MQMYTHQPCCAFASSAGDVLHKPVLHMHELVDQATSVHLRCREQKAVAPDPAIVAWMSNEPKQYVGI